MSKHDSHTALHDRSGLETSSSFEIEPIKTKTGRWSARLWYVTRQGKKKHYVCSAVLREPARGGIILDLGSRKSGGRKRLGTRNYQEAVTLAEGRLKKIGQVLVAEGRIERTLEMAGGDLTVQQVAAVYFDQKNPRKGNIGQHHANNVALAFDVMLELNGPDWTVSCADQEWIDRMIRRQMEGIDFSRVDRPPLRPRSFNTARDAVGYFMGAVSLACRTPDPDRPREQMQDLDPFAREDVQLPSNRAPERKRTVTIDDHLRLMKPVARGDEILAAPIDRANPSGAARLMQAAFFHYGVRRTQLRIARRGHIALTPREVRHIVVTHGHYIRDEDWKRFAENGLWLFEGKDNKMGHVDAEGYTRVLPIPSDLREEVELYFDRNPETRDADSDAPLFPSSSASNRPVSDKTAFGPHEWEWEVSDHGEPLLDNSGRKIVTLGPDGRQVIEKLGGWFPRAEEFVRDDLEAEGLDWDEIYPYRTGSLVHPWRAHLEVLLETLQYLRTVETEASGPVNLTRHVDYWLGRKMDDSVRFQHYIPIDSDVILGLAEFKDADEVLKDRGMRKAEAIRDDLDRLRAARTELRRNREVA